jgi:CheY-like chemotaxis protein
LGFADLLKRNGLPLAKREQYSSIILKSGKQLLSIVDDIIRISSIDTGKEKANTGAVKVPGMLKELKAIFENQAKGKDIHFFSSVSLPTKDYMVYTDQTKLFQVLSNLLTNALKFTRKGAISLGCQLDGEDLIFYVKDTGIGILEKNQAKIFDRFWQEERELSKKAGGTGLGLAICKAYVELLGGKIWLESKKENGSCFYFTIPNRPVEQVNKDTISSVKKKYQWEGKKVLVAEDEEVNFIYLSELLKTKGIESVHAWDGQEAVENVKKSDFDLILMDIKMPVKNGFDATSEIISLKPDLPIIAQTAYTDAVEREKAFSAGCKGFITKPITEESLVQEIQKFLK